MFPVFEVQPGTIALAASIGLGAGFIAALFPILRTLKTTIANGLRSIG
jgi:ABC-type antimicrobial peptide transport system permease subunit